MKNNLKKASLNDSKKDIQDTDLPGYEHYPEEEDIYNQALEETEIDPEDTSKMKTDNPDPEAMNEKDFEESVTGEDLDVPGNEQDEENISDVLPDEENNYYSLGGDNHDNLEENSGMDKM
jgi:hypothetical protein